ncbi:MAG: enolase C-terminal domain-like protein [Alsobacter sp.]
MRAYLLTADLHYGAGFMLHTASSGPVPHLSALYLRLAEGGMTGIGEVRTNIAYLNGLSDDQVVAAARRAVGTVDWGRTPEELLATMGAWAADVIAPVRMLIDMALQDLVARRQAVSVAARHGASGQSQAWKTNQTLFWSSLEAFVAKAEGYVERGFTDLKLRVAVGGIDEDLARLAALRSRFGGGVTLAVDANGQWPVSVALDRVKALAEYGLAYVEQPVPAGDWAAIDRLAAHSPVPVMLDEGVSSPDDLGRICGYEGRILAHLKLVKLGGIGPTVAAARMLAAAGVPFMVGQMNEGGAATAAALHVALATEPAFAELYGADGLVDDPVAGVAYGAGTVRTDSPTGLGVSFDPAAASFIGEFGHG